MKSNSNHSQKKEVKEDNSLFRIIDKIDSKDIDRLNKKKSWNYGYNPEFDVVVISKDGTIGEVYEIQGLHVALPSTPKNIYKRDRKKEEQYWESFEYPKELQKINSVFQWNEYPNEFKNKYVAYIEGEFDRREEGFWFYNNGIPTYISGTHYMYLQWTKIDVGHAEFREANRVFFLFWEACIADERSYGMCYLKNRRSGFSFMSSAELVNTATLARDSRLGILSKTGNDAKKMFTDKVVPISGNYPFFFKPIMDGMDKPKTELAYRVPASKITKNNMSSLKDDVDGLDTTIDWKNTADNSYDGEKLLRLVHDESGKWEVPNNILNNWRVTKTCLRLGRRIIGKCMMGSTSNSIAKGGGNYKSLYNDSDVKKRNANGQTLSGLYALFIPMEWNFEGYIDVYGHPVFRTPDKPIRDIQGGFIYTGVIDYWENEVSALKSNSDALNEFYRQFPRTESHAFRDEAKNSLYDLAKIYEQIDYNDGLEINQVVNTGKFAWKNGVKDTEVVWIPSRDGNFKVTWFPNKDMINKIEIKNGKKYPGNVHVGAFGCDTYDISGVVGGGGSKGSLHGLTKFNMDDAPSNFFFLEYIARPRTSEEFYEDCLMACVFYGMPILIENNKVGQLRYFYNRGYTGFCLRRPDKHKNDLSSSEKELGGIPSSTQVIELHANALEAYIDQYVGIDYSGQFREAGKMGSMFFNRTLLDWANYDITNRTKFDATISSGFAIMANQTYVSKPIRDNKKIMFNFARYSNKGLQSELLK
ncbi:MULTISPECIES: hypothetical protein [Flavobacteriaceae]|uniref:hypothetical protein n=1 Tax=Flavobacteriaceae TaxID=49546 RepID=UPI0025D1B048|nr:MULTISPECIES: hypothetical protein [Flavobacteriaceae]